MPIGEVPLDGFQLVDGVWLKGFAGGHNRLFQSGLTAVGNSQATSLQMADRLQMLQIDTSSASTGAALPPAIAGVEIYVNNNTSNNITIYPSIANNPTTSAQDTFNNNASSFTLNANSGVSFVCAKNGRWFTS